MDDTIKILRLRNCARFQAQPRSQPFLLTPWLRRLGALSAVHTVPQLAMTQSRNLCATRRFGKNCSLVSQVSFNRPNIDFAVRPKGSGHAGMVSSGTLPHLAECRFRDPLPSIFLSPFSLSSDRRLLRQAAFAEFLSITWPRTASGIVYCLSRDETAKVRAATGARARLGAVPAVYTAIVGPP